MSAAAPLGYLRRAAFVQIPLELLIASAERKGIAFVYGWLWHHAGRHDNAFPSIDTLASECRMKADDVRQALRYLVEQGWVQRQERPGTTTLFHVRMEAGPPGPPPAPATKPSQQTPPPNGGPHPSPKRGTPPLPQTGGGNKNQRTRTREQEENTPQPSLREGSPPLGAPPASGQMDSESVSGGNSRQPLAAADRPADQPVKRQRRGLATSSQQPLEIPAFAEPCRSLLSAWQVLRRKRHRVSAEAALSPRSIKALQYAHDNGVLEQFAELAAEAGWLSLGFNGHRDYIQKLAADGCLNNNSRHSGFGTVGSGAAGRPTTRQSDAAERAIALFSSSPEVTCSPPPTSSTSWPVSSNPCPSTRLSLSEG